MLNQHPRDRRKVACTLSTLGLDNAARIWQSDRMKACSPANGNQCVVLYDSSDPHATPKAVEAAAFRRYVNSYAVRDQREVVAALASGLKTIDQQGPLSNDPRAMAAPLPQPCRTLPTRKVAETLRRYPDAWAMNVMQKVIHGKMALNGEATDREDE